ncbi:DNA topoisomerase IB [Naasia sp. SYSU D00948]|uniref:DNA topoisomerase IB n=1 Tax=Naasia sp. SYSU D00948 TaxID=2817379 RepID=UPI001B3178D7|nr:DNA topoisomerase IB [Naasia sp. SYSU D00948]
MVRLRRSIVGAKDGYTRRRRGKGFSYHSLTDGRPVTDPELKERFDSLGIPPAWTNVWIAPYDNGHIQAIGFDRTGRKQYMYHPYWREKKDKVKYDRALRLSEVLRTARARVTKDLHSEGPTKERALAAAFRMLDNGSLRVGSEQYEKEHGSHGLSTLLGSHVTVSGDVVKLRFPGKSGQEWDSDLEPDADLAKVVRSLKRRGPTARLLAWKDERGWHPLSAADINDYVRERTGGDFTAKDFRTLHGTVEAAKSLAEQGPQPSPAKRKKAVAKAMRDASEVLGNTPTVARASYVDPRVVEHYEKGETIDPDRPKQAESEVRALLYPGD